MKWAIEVSLLVGAVDGDEQVGEPAAGTVVDDAVLVPDAGLGLPAVAAHQAADPGRELGQASAVAHEISPHQNSDVLTVCGNPNST